MNQALRKSTEISLMCASRRSIAFDSSVSQKRLSTKPHETARHKFRDGSRGSLVSFSGSFIGLLGGHSGQNRLRQRAGNCAATIALAEEGRNDPRNCTKPHKQLSWCFVWLVSVSWWIGWSTI